MQNLKTIPNEFIIPNQSNLKNYRNHCLLLPIDAIYRVTAYGKKSGKNWRQEFLDYLLLSNKINSPQKNKQQHIEDVNNNFSNLTDLIRANMDSFTPCLSLAYPIANCWIVVFYADIFDKSKKNIYVPEEIVDSNYDPVAYSFKNFK